ncbi:MAG: PEP-utilizing enzyme [Candidatus Micrarchaeota archaeon]
MAAKYFDIGSRNKPLFSNYGAAFVMNEQMPGTDVKFHNFFTHARGELAAFCLREDEFGKLLKIQLREFEKGRYSEGFFKNLIAFYQKPFAELQKRLNKSYRGVSNAQLIYELEFAYRRAFLNHPPMIFGLIAQNMKDYFNQELEKTLSRKERADPQSLLKFSSMLLVPPRQSLPQKEEQLFWEIESEFIGHFSKRKPATREFDRFISSKNAIDGLHRLEKECGWFHMEYMMDPWVVNDYRLQLRKRMANFEGMVGLSKSPKAMLRAVLNEQKRFFLKHPNGKFKALVQAMQQMAIVLDHTKEIMVNALFLMRPLMTEIGKRLGLTWLEVQYLVPDEIAYLLKKKRKADRNMMLKRMRERAVLMVNGEITIYSGKSAYLMAKKLIRKEVIAQNQELRGLAVYPGKVIGIVRIIRSQKDHHKFRKGDILVSHDISTELTQYLKLAAAIVADMGGLISHAATVAREFKTPTVLQTKFATKILKDGDLIEVNANIGTIRIISKG